MIETIEAAFCGDIDAAEAADAVREAIALLNRGEASLAQPDGAGGWSVNGWV